MSTTDLLIWILVSGRITAVAFIVWVMVRQVYLFRETTVPKGDEWIREILFVLAAVLLLSNLVPLVIDSLITMEYTTKTNGEINPVGATYTIANMITSVASAMLVFALYVIAKITARDK